MDPLLIGGYSVLNSRIQLIILEIESEEHMVFGSLMRIENESNTGHKFHIRAYVVCTCINPVKLYLNTYDIVSF